MVPNKKRSFSTDELLRLEEKYCSRGDTVHYSKNLKIFERAKGIYLYDEDNVEYLDLQMWYSAASFGYGNERLNQALKNQIDRLPQLACQDLHKEKIELATKLCHQLPFILPTQQQKLIVLGAQ